MRAGVLEIPSFEVTVVYAIDAKRSEPTRLATEPKGLKVGDSLRRTIRIDAEGTFAMMLPPTTFEPIEGLTAYPDPPEVEERAGERGASRIARRVDAVSYRLEREGEYRLPAVEVAWWDVEAQRLRTASVPPVAFPVAAAPARADEIPLPPEEAAGLAEAPAAAGAWRDALRRWAPRIVAAALLLVLVGRPLMRGVPRLRASIAAWRQRRHDSEPAAFRRLRRAAASHDAAATHAALLSWIARRPREAVAPTLDALLETSSDAELTEQVTRLQARLYGRPGVGDTAWSGPLLVERLGALRQRRGTPAAEGAWGLRPLNPTAAQAP